MKGFSSPPTTHYTRPIQLAITPQQLCNHGVSSFDFNLEYALDFMNVYNNSGFFGFMHIKQYTHNQGLNDIRWLDDSLYRFYENFNVTICCFFCITDLICQLHVPILKHLWKGILLRHLLITRINRFYVSSLKLTKFIKLCQTMRVNPQINL